MDRTQSLFSSDSAIVSDESQQPSVQENAAFNRSASQTWLRSARPVLTFFVRRALSPMPAAESLRNLVQRFPRAGRVEAIVLRPDRREPARYVEEVRAEPGFGLMGDRRAAKERIGDELRKRELTLIQAEHLPVIAGWCGVEKIEATRLRRNLVISGVNLLAMRSPFRGLGLEWSIGEEVSIEITGNCDPCSLMEAELGPGGYNALRGHGGLTAIIRTGGTIRVGDSVVLKKAAHAGGEGL